MTKHYVDNGQFLQAIVEYKQGVRDAQEHNREKPALPDYIGSCLLMIANRLSTRPNFARYSYREDMVADGIENCVQYFDNFNPEISSNPFAYFTQVIYWAFLRRIEKEKKQLYVKHKVIERSSIFNELVDYQEGEDGEFETVAYNAQDQAHHHEFIKSFEDRMEKRRAKEMRGIEQFMEEVGEDLDE